MSEKSPSAAATATAGKTVRCPQCGGASLFVPGNRYRPFCGERCKNLDLGLWASEGFKLPEPTPEGLGTPFEQH